TAWRGHLCSGGATGLILARQKIPGLGGTAELAPPGLARGADALRGERRPAPGGVLIGTGSAVQVGMRTRAQRPQDGIDGRIVSMPSWSLFEEQTPEYRSQILPPDVPTLAVEAGVTFGWERYADDVVGINRFGASAPGEVVMRELGITPEHAAER